MTLFLKRGLVFLVVAITMALGVFSKAMADFSFSFDGKVDFMSNQADIKVSLDDKSFINASAAMIDPNNFGLKIKVNHIRASHFDLSTDINSSLALSKNVVDLSSIVSGKIRSQYSLLDFKPTHELSGEFQLTQSRLSLSEVSFGGITCNGFVDLLSPFAIDMSVKLNSFDIEEIVRFWSGEDAVHSRGEVSGEIKATGEAGRLFLKGKLNGVSGQLGDFAFDKMNLELEGNYPVVMIAKSPVLGTDGVSFFINGPINLKDPSKFLKQIKDLTYLPHVKTSNDKTEWTVQQSEESGSTTKLKYLLRDDKFPGSKSKNDSSMIGVERSVEF